MGADDRDTRGAARRVMVSDGSFSTHIGREEEKKQTYVRVGSCGKGKCNNEVTKCERFRRQEIPRATASYYRRVF